MSAIADLTCAEMTLAYRRGELSPVEVARGVLSRIERHAAFNVFLAVDADGVLAAATQSETRWRAVAPFGPLDGVPASVKDNIWATGLPTRRSSRTSDPTPAAARSAASPDRRPAGGRPDSAAGGPGDRAGAAHAADA